MLQEINLNQNVKVIAADAIRVLVGTIFCLPTTFATHVMVWWRTWLQAKWAVARK
ncbi:hypothetical protein H4F05_07140 [Vibrio cholerae]